MKQTQKALCSILQLLALCLLAFNANAQQQLADSMDLVLKGNLTDSARANTMLLKAMYYETVDTAKAHSLYREARAFAENKKQDYFIAKTWQYEGFLYNLQGNHEKAVENLLKVLPYVEHSDKKHFRQLYTKALTNLSTSYLGIGDTKNALTYQMKELTVAEQSGLERVVDYLNVANIYSRMEDKEQQEKYDFKALDLAKAHKSEPELLQVYVYLAVYYTGAKKYMEAKLYADTARLFHYTGYDAFKKAVNADQAYNTFQAFYLAVATAFTNVNIDDSAKLYYDSAYQFARRFNVQRDLVEPKLQLGYINLKQKHYPEAEKLLLETMQTAKEVEDLKAQGHVSEFLSRLYYETGAYKNAYEYYKDFHTINDSITGLEKKKYARQLEVQYETEKKESQIRLQQAELKAGRFRNFLLTLSLIALVAITLLIILAYNRKQRLLQKEATLKNKEIESLQQEKQLAAVQAIVRGQEEERTRLARDLHDGLGGILSSAKYSFINMKERFILTDENAMAFEKSMGMLDKSIAELRRVAHNMMPESLTKLSLDEALQDYCQQVTDSGALGVTYQSFGVNDSITDNTVKTTVYRIVQELINNTVKHAEAVKALVQLIVKDGVLNITVEDDGKGFDVRTLETAAGIGFKNIMNRVDFLKGKLDIQSAAGKGSSVYIEIPIQQ